MQRDIYTAIVRDLAETAPTVENDFGQVECVLCAGWKWAHEAKLGHEPSCPWVRARAILGLDT